MPGRGASSANGIGQREIETYLQGNAALRRALGLSADAPLAARPLGMGEHNLNYRLTGPNGERFVLRVNVTKQPFHEDQVLYEFDALKALEPCGRTPLPLFLDDSAQAPGEGVLAESFCEGAELDFDRLRPGDVRCAVQLMADVHAVPVAAATLLLRPADPLRALFDECRGRYDLYRGSAFAEAYVVSALDELFAITANALGAPRYEGDACHIVNTETLPSHFLIPAASAEAAARWSGRGRICDAPGSFVDWERPIIGEVAEDLAFFTSPSTTFWDSDYLFPPDAVEGLLHDYWQAVDGRFACRGFHERFAAYRMVTTLRGLTWCTRAVVQFATNPNLHRTERAERKVPIYLSADFLARMKRECF